MTFTAPAKLRPRPPVAALIATAMALTPVIGVSQTEMPSAAEVHDAIATLRKLERALDETSRPSQENRPSAIPVPGNTSLSIANDFDLGGIVYQDGVPLLHADGGINTGNTALGIDALVNVTPGLPEAFSGKDNSALGMLALLSNLDGYRNTALGTEALLANLYGNHNTAVGFQAMSGNESGSANTAMGPLAGSAWTTGHNNIAIGAGATGVADESGVIRIGGLNNQTTTFIEGISNATVTGAPVAITASDELGLIPSASRFKRDISDLDDIGERLDALRPVSFRYTDAVRGSDDSIRFGLLAEEVAEVFPELVVEDEEGRPLTVLYRMLAPLLLAQVQDMQREIRRLVELESEVATLRGEMALCGREPMRITHRLGVAPGVDRIADRTE